MAGLVPETIVLALGVGVLGGLDALRLLLEAVWRNPLLDIFTCVLAMAVVTAHVLGNVLLARFVSKARAGGGGGAAAAGAPAADTLPWMTATVSVGAAFLAAVCLFVGSGGLGAFRLWVDFVARRSLLVNTSVAVVGAVILARFSRRGRNAAGGGSVPAPATDTDTRRFAKMTRGTPLALAVVAFALAPLIIAIPFAQAQRGRERGALFLRPCLVPPRNIFTHHIKRES
ncbi:unnamed protein product [Urochloa humidicola]